MTNISKWYILIFLLANGSQSLIDEIKICYENNSAMDSVLHNKALDLYRLYLCVGGMPEAINNLIANKNSLIYWESGNQAEVDFILYNNDGIIPIEVKANDNVGSQSLNVYIKRYNPKYAIRISTKNFGISNNIKSVPLYAAFLVE